LVAPREPSLAATPAGAGATRSAAAAELRKLLANLLLGEIAVFQDEVDINSNPKIGAMWMVRRRQAQVPTPSRSQKRYLVGPLN